MSNPQIYSQFLEELANKYGFYGDTRKAFLVRFAHENAVKPHTELRIDWTRDPVEKEQKLLDELKNNIYPVLQKEGCDIPENNKRGRSKKGESPWEKAHRWLWQIKFTEWEKSHNSSIVLEKSIDWQKICIDILNELPKRHQATGRGMGHEVNIDVPLGLVKSETTSRCNSDAENTDSVMQQGQLPDKTEIEKSYEYQEFLDEIIRKTSNNLAIVGEPGAGKTTWLDRISQEIKQDFCVIWIPLENLGGLTLEEYLLTKWLKDTLKVLEPTEQQKQALVDLFSSDRVWLLLDGVDEMKTEVSPLSNINKFLTGWVKKARVVLTCRLNIWEANPNGLPEFETYRTLDFNQEQVKDFIVQWFGQKPGF
ncbi:NACHT domain-containing protein [Spirulina subsalsa]|uniref:NACHT domain-containing protein n=1 Tax=Spirulina subsalsa TaxID=54311 RepID=UPI000312166F|nr:NACHT domain-containing protein [Spirulina subsalsa]